MMKTQLRLGFAMHVTFTGVYVLSWFLWTWAAGTLPTRSNCRSWHGLESDLKTWNLNKPHMQCVRCSRTTSTAWTGSRQPGCRLSQSLWVPTTSITTGSGSPWPLQKNKSAYQSPMAFCNDSCMMAMMTRRQDSFCSAVLKHWLATTARFGWYTGSCSPFNDMNCYNMQSWANHQRFQPRSSPASRAGAQAEDSELRRTRGASQVSFKQSLPGPNSRDERIAPSTEILESSLVDVKVGGYVGQQPPEAYHGVRRDPHNNANHYGQTFMLQDPKGKTCIGRPALQEQVSIHLFIIRTRRQTIKGIFNHRPIPRGALAGTMILLLALLAIPAPKQVTKHCWQVTRIMKGTYRRRLSIIQNLKQRPPMHRKSACNRPPSGRLLVIVMLLMLLSCAHASPNHTSRLLPIQAEQARGHATLCAKKHSFQRAQRQALLHGTAVYRGRRMTDRHLGVTWSANVPQKQPKAKASDNTPRIRVITWNSGGHNLVRQAEVRTWLESESRINPVHILCIQETHWPCSSEYRDGPWTCVHSGTGSREGGILFMVNTEYFKGLEVKRAEVQPGRLLHLRICSDPAIDLFGVYQHAWNPAKAEFQHQQQTPEQLLLGKRQVNWQRIQSWTSGVPKRNLLVILGDFNSTLEVHPPNVGHGVGHAHAYKTDAQALQSLLITAGLTAVNTWSKPGQAASTFWTHRGEGSQIDYIITRNPVNHASLKSSTLPQAPIVHPTGFRHIPVQCYFTWPKPPKQQQQSMTWTASRVNQASARCPQLIPRFRAGLAHMSCAAEQLNANLLEAWQCSQQPPVQLPLATSQPDRICLKTFWEVKRHLRVLTNTCLEDYVILQPACLATTFQNAFHTTRRFFQHILKCWRTAAQFQKQNSALKARSTQARKQKLEKQIEEAIAADRKGLTYLYKCMNTMRPKNPKRTVHIKSKDGRLQSNEGELATIKEHFGMVFSSSEPPVLPEWHLQSPLEISQHEIRQAVRSLSAKKALPKGHAPSGLWKAGEDFVVRVLHSDFSSRFIPGKIDMPADWHTSFITLIPKPGKPPTSPQNLRPISLLPAIPKLLARIAAQRLRPYLLEAVHHIPQFAYIAHRQTSDSIDRVMAHCQQIRTRTANNRFNPFKPGQGRAKFSGGMQLSLDLAKAFDKMPRHYLLQALERISLPEDLISLILYIHDNALMCFSKGDASLTMSTGSGVRQGCGLAPLLWVAFTVLLFDRFSEYLSIDQITGFADDLHMHWVLQDPLHFRNACAQVGFVLTDLADMGMQVSTDKTVILLALTGPSYDKVTAPYIQRRKKERYLKVVTRAGPVILPIKSSHVYLGVKISYRNFERQTMQYRLQQSWQAFHRLSSFLCSKRIPVQQRLRLWKTCVQSIARYGLDSVGLDEVSASKYRPHTARQLRRIADSVGHLTHETNQELHARLGVPDPVSQLYDMVISRVEQSKHYSGHLYSQVVAQRLVSLVSDMTNHRQPAVQQKGELTEVTQVLRVVCSCDICGQQFASFHALRTHIGKRHPENSIALTKESYSVRAERKDSHMRHAQSGLPQCNKCGKHFSGWPSFMSHFNHRACPVLHSMESEADNPGKDNSLACGTSASEGAIPPDQVAEYVPVFSLPSAEEVAKTGNLSRIASHLRQFGKPDKCPECGMHCNPMYISRHACKQHTWIQQANAQVIEWVKNSQIPSNPCQWCGTQFKTSNKAHRNACPILWMCGHLLHKHSTLIPLNQGSLHGYGRQRGIGKSCSGIGQLQELHESEPGSHSDHLSREPASSKDACGPDDKERRRERRHGQGGAGQGQVAQGAGEGLPKVQRPTEPELTTGTEILVGGPGPARFFQEQRDRAEIRNQSLGTASPSSGGFLVGDAPRQPVCRVYEKQRLEHRVHAGLERHQPALFSWKSLEGPQGTRAAKLDPAAPHGAPELMANRHQISNRRDPEQSSQPRAGHQDGDLGGRELPLPSMEPGGEQAYQGGAGSAIHGGGDSSDRPAPVAHHSPQYNWEVPPVASVDAGHGERCHTLDAGSPKPHTGSPGGLSTDRPFDPERSDAPCCVDAEAEQAWKVAPGHGSGQDDSRTLRPDQYKLLQLILRNPKNYSYANSAIFSILWMSSCSQADFLCREDLRKFLQWLSTQHKPQPIWDNWSWQTLTKSWPQPLRSHDVADFLEFLQPMIFKGKAGQWQSRASTPDPVITPQVVQCGHVWPIALPSALHSETACTLQQLVDSWHNQPQVHGLSDLSRFVALQIPRFKPDGSKALTQITAPWTVHLPHFTGSFGNLGRVPYVAHSMIMHDGESIMQGHYRAVLLEAGAPKYVVEDGRKPAKLTPKVFRRLENQVYIVFLERIISQDSQH